MDSRGRTGRVTETLNVEYEGVWKRDVIECVERIERRAREDGVEEQFLSNRIVIGLYNEAPIDEVERIDGSEID